MIPKRIHTLTENRDDGSASVSCKRSKCSEDCTSRRQQDGGCDDEDLTEEETITEHDDEEPDDDSEPNTEDSLEGIDAACTGLEEMWSILLTDIWKLEQDSCQDALEQLATILNSELDFAEKLACFLQLGGQFAVVGALERWPDNPEIQDFGCSVFAVLTNDESFVHDDQTLSVACGLKFILSAMKRFPSRRNLQMSGCCILSRCCCVQELAAYAVYEMNCVGSIVDAMMNFDKDSQVLRWGCWSLCTLSRWKRCRPTIVQAGGFGLLAFVVGSEGASSSEDNSNTEELHKAARNALNRLVRHKDQIYW